VYSEKVIVFVIAPVVVFLTIVEKPFSDLTGPEKVVFAIFSSFV
jgi:hypothetical protein